MSPISLRTAKSSSFNSENSFPTREQTGCVIQIFLAALQVEQFNSLF
jgi:hypothetical protein